MSLFQLTALATITLTVASDCSLNDKGGTHLTGAVCWLEDVLQEARLTEPPDPSRLPGTV
jgi:hypothetical protein